jgi:transcriptional regulator with PAS, ATPase and Fis domain
MGMGIHDSELGRERQGLDDAGEAERRLILATLGAARGQKAAGSLLGISLKTIYNRLNAYKATT